MIRNLLKITIRNFKRQFGFSLLNILGLTIGMASFILIFLWISDELSYEKSYKNADQIYLVHKEYQVAGQIQYNSTTPLPLAPRLKNSFAEIESAIRISNMRSTVEYDGQTYSNQRLCASDPDYINLFDLEFIAGDRNTVLDEPHSVIIAKKIADRYFKNENPLGKVLKINNNKSLTVTGVYKNPPEKSTIRYELVGRFDFLVENDDNRNDWANHRYRTMILVSPDADMKALDQKMSDLIQAQIPEEKIAIKTLALDKLRLYTIDGKNQRIQYVHLFMAIAFFIIFIACINFMNLSTAKASRRSKEIGLRKVVGGSRGMLIFQFITESVLFAAISIFLAMMLVELFRPIFNQLTSKQISIDYSDIMVYIKLAVLVLFMGILSGSYPAFVMSSFKPILAIKNGIHLGVKGVLFRKFLVILQFTISIFLIISTFFIFFQIRSIQHKDLGFDKKNVIAFDAEGKIGTNFQAFKNELLSNKEIVNVTRATQLPNDIENIFRNVSWEDMQQEEGSTFGAGTIDYDYFETMKMEIVEGRSFSREYGRDSINVIFNQTAIKLMGYENPIGRSFAVDDANPGKIIGVVKDFNSRPLTEKIEPVMFIIYPQWCRVVLVRLEKTETESALKHIEKTYKEFAPQHPFNYTFLDQSINEQYQSEQNIGTLSAIFSFIAIIISCLGLYGLAAYTADQKKKEIGIRKVFGADTNGIIYKLSKSFAIWVLIANIIAWPLAWLVMDNWLKNFAYRIDLYWWVFVLSGVLALLIALATVVFQVTKASRKNPMESLRYE
ncbi:MAG: hypothetical protein CVU00_05665 [Bacteroidetes bacterium HGW-Bacteroidetes-17]|jgi:predicted permease|nr:MAG: hypothetical protein CVU00_05665 [Bacteroidetes bacterium HGW-Bacteroidetes-17]